MSNNLWKSNLPDGILDPRANVIANNKSRANGSDPNWTANTLKMLKERHNDPEWLAKMDALNKERAADPESFWNKQNRAGAQRRSEYGQWLKENDPEEHKRYFGTTEKHTEETIAKMKVSATNRWKDEEARRAHSEKLKKPKNTIVCEHCGKKMSTSNYKKYGHHTAQCQVYTIMIEGVKYFNPSDAAEKLGYINANGVRARLKSKTKKWKDWCYIKEKE